MSFVPLDRASKVQRELGLRLLPHSGGATIVS